MPPKAKSQWDFSGELFPTQELRRVLTVSEITGNVRRLIEERRIAFHKIGVHVRIAESDVLAFITAGRVAPARLVGRNHQ